jgi:hypothetical protein
MGRRVLFLTPYEQYRDRHETWCEVLGLVDPSTYDADEVGAAYRIRFDDGFETSAWPEEIGDDPEALRGVGIVPHQDR